MEERESLEHARARIIAENKQAKIDKINKLKKYPQRTEEYLGMIEDIQAIKVENRYWVNQYEIRWHYEVGERIYNFDKDIFFERIFDDSHISAQVLAQSSRFYKHLLAKNQTLEQFLAKHGKNITWTHITHKIIPDPKKAKPEQQGVPKKTPDVKWVKCPYCGAFFSAKANITK